MKNNYTDGFFNISLEHGFLPIKEPLDKLPDRYNEIQLIIDQLPNLIVNNDNIKAIVDSK